MARSAPTPVDRQLAVAARRLFLQTLLNRLVVAWTAALAAAAVWFLAEPYLVAPISYTMPPLTLPHPRVLCPS